jgi:hypothetical protein
MRTIQPWIAGSGTTAAPARSGPGHADHHRTHIHIPTAT